MSVLSVAELQLVLGNIESQRRELEAAQRQPADQKSLEILGLNYVYGALPEKQRQAIATEIEYAIEPEIDKTPEDFLKTFIQTMRSELCEEGGVLFKRWKQYQDLDAESLAEAIADRLDKFGFEGRAIATLTEAVSVCILWLGVKVFCDRYADS